MTEFLKFLYKEHKGALARHLSDLSEKELKISVGFVLFCFVFLNKVFDFFFFYPLTFSVYNKITKGMGFIS